MVLPVPAVIVHDLLQIQVVLAAKRPVLLCSAPAAALYMGCGWWAQMLRESGHAGLSLLDCADAPGRALEALEERLPGIILNCAEAAFMEVAQIASRQHAILVRQAPAALNMAERGAGRRLATWLKS